MIINVSKENNLKLVLKPGVQSPFAPNPLLILFSLHLFCIQF